MFAHVAKLKRVLDKIAGPNETSLFLCLGDLNTMGLNAAFNNTSDLSCNEEIDSLIKRFNRVNMRPLQRSQDLTWWNGGDNYFPGSTLDHVFADKAMKIRSLAGGAEVEVSGWPEKNTKTQKRAWIDKHSDHALLFGVVEK